MPHITSINRGIIYDVCHPSLPPRSVFLKLCSRSPCFPRDLKSHSVKKKIKETEKNNLLLNLNLEYSTIDYRRRSHKNLYKKLSFCRLLTDFVPLTFI
jgi:hypothetical protein